MATSTERKVQKVAANIVDISNAFTNQCCALIICAYFKIIEAKSLKRNWAEETITQHLKKHLKLCIQEAELQYCIVPEYPEDDENIEGGLKDVKKSIYFDLMFSTFDKNEQLYVGVEAKIVIERDFLKRVATTELAEYISLKGMRKFVEGIYKKRGVMLGYVIDGNPTIIVEKLNQKIESDTFYTRSEKLIKSELLEGFVHSYSSNHEPRINYNIQHLFLDFSSEEQ